NYKVSFTYDAEGLRTSKTVNGEKTVFVWDGDQLVMELSVSGKVKNRYIRGNDLVYTDKGTDTEKQYYVADPHGNVVQLTDESGKVVKTYEYDSFGNEVKPDSKDDNPFRYCGEYYDKETEEVYLRARYYQPAAGRFLTRDSYTGESDDPESLHLYTYCGNDGVNMWDPSGHWKQDVHVTFTNRWFKETLEKYKGKKSVKELLKSEFYTNSSAISIGKRNKGVDDYKEKVRNAYKNDKKGWDEIISWHENRPFSGSKQKESTLVHAKEQLDKAIDYLKKKSIKRQ
ncbi:MAG: RHS repeat-associated core domain-containing protein, partial [Ruminococcus flavefaciens]|nr:RHS repeat-associated core domain-containing protein [Ruminococcus flavefaciens]